MVLGLLDQLQIFWWKAVLDGKSSQEYPVYDGVPQGSIPEPTPFLLYINDLHDNIICDIANYADDTTLYSKFDLTFWSVATTWIGF